jgi:hypothetical protein
MDTGTQRGVRVYLEDCEWRKWISRTASLLIAPLLALMIMIAPAHAAIDTVPAETFTAGLVLVYGNPYKPEWHSATPAEFCVLALPAGFHSPTATQANAAGHCYAIRDCCGDNVYVTFYNPYYVCPSGYTQANSNSSCTKTACPIPTVHPNISYVLNTATGMCVRTLPDKCTVLDPFPEFLATDKCSLSLEDGKGKDIYKACPALDPEMLKQEACLASKITKLGLSYDGTTSTVRTVAYQQHFVDLWEWYKVKIPDAQKKWSASQKQACAPIVAKVNAEWKTHVLNGAPSNSGPNSPHVIRKAVDISRKVVDEMIIAVTKTTFYIPFACLLCDADIPVDIGDVQDYVNNPLINPPPCNLRWGGRFKGKKFDPVHFDLLIK